MPMDDSQWDLANAMIGGDCGKPAIQQVMQRNKLALLVILSITGGFNSLYPEKCDFDFKCLISICVVMITFTAQDRTII